MAEKTLNDAKINVYFEETATRMGLTSGEEITTLFGKTKKWLSDLKPVAFSGDADTVNGKTVGTSVPTGAVFTDTKPSNGKLTIQVNGSSVQTFTANQSTAATANITVPTKLSQLTNDILKCGTAAASTSNCAVGCWYGQYT